jgi:hypothetical protein
MRLKADCAEPLVQRCCAYQPRRRPAWTTRHPARFKKHADRRPLLQQSLSKCGRVVQPGNRAAFPSAAHLVRLTDRHSIRTAAGALRRPYAPHLECMAPGANVSSFASPFHTPACEDTTTPGANLGGFVLSAQQSLLSDKAHCSLRRIDAALSTALLLRRSLRLGIVLALSPEQVLLHCFWGFDQRQ